MYLFRDFGKNYPLKLDGSDLGRGDPGSGRLLSWTPGGSGPPNQIRTGTGPAAAGSPEAGDDGGAAAGARWRVGKVMAGAATEERHPFIVAALADSPESESPQDTHTLFEQVVRRVLTGLIRTEDSLLPRPGPHRPHLGSTQARADR